MVAIRADKMERLSKSRSPLPLGPHDRAHIYQHCGDHRLKTKSGFKSGGHFVDPLLKLYYHTPLMLVTNDDVPNGHANGTRVLLEAVVLKEGCVPDTVSFDGLECPIIDSTSVDHLVCSSESNPNKIFRIHSRKLSCAAKVPVPKEFGADANTNIRFSLSCIQFPLLVNSATTGHKLQGQSKQDLVISVWSKALNWNYVALSRVRTRSGLYLVSPLPYKADFSIPEDLDSMMKTLAKCSPTTLEWDLEEEVRILENRRRIGIAANNVV
jgi:hypothetical protein